MVAARSMPPSIGDTSGSGVTVQLGSTATGPREVSEADAWATFGSSGSSTGAGDAADVNCNAGERVISAAPFVGGAHVSGTASSMQSHEVPAAVDGVGPTWHCGAPSLPAGMLCCGGGASSGSAVGTPEGAGDGVTSGRSGRVPAAAVTARGGGCRADNCSVGEVTGLKLDVMAAASRPPGVITMCASTHR